MNRGQLRSLLSRQLNDVAVQDWSTSDLNDALNHGLLAVEKLVLQMQPDAIRAIATQDITATEFFEKPADFWYEYKIRALVNGSYVDLDKADYDVAAKRADGGNTTYSHFGNYIAIRPIPTASVTAGLQWLYTPTLSMAADTDVPKVHLGLHRLIMIEAALSLLPETGESTKELLEARTRERAEAPGWLRMSAGENEVFIPQITKGY